MLSAKEIVVKYIQTDGTQDNIIIEPYFWQEFGGKWVSPNHKNTEAHVIYDNRLESPGLTRIVDVMGAPSFDQVWREREIDLVYTWVNHADPEWAALYQRYKAEVDDKHGNLATPRPQSDDSTALTRFHSNDELRYSLRSVAENLPWVRRIYIFSNCAAPDWLNAEHTRLRWVRHEDVIPQEYLPTFSSHVIESFLHNMPDLSGHFIYMNDDVFIGRPLGKNFFFTEGGAPCLLLEPYGVVNGPITEGAADYLNAARNSASLIRDAFGFSPTRLHRHSPFSLRRDLLDEIEERWPHQIDAMRHNKFRTAQDLNIPSFLAHHYGLATGRAVLGNGNCILVKSQDIRWRLQLKRVIDKNPDTFCINEGGAAPAGKDWHRYVRIFLQTMWPDPAPWEVEATK